MQRVHRLLALSMVFACHVEPPVVSVEGRDWRDERIYQVVVDRFANGDNKSDASEDAPVDASDLRRHQGGDWRGLTERLNYIAALGMTAIWISPVVTNVPRSGDEDGYHGYWATDFTAVNTRFGTAEELRALVSAAHARGLRVIVDIAPNHTGRVFDYDLNGNGTLDEGESEPPFRLEGYDVPLLWRTEAALRYRGERLILNAEHFHRRGRFESSGLSRQTGDFPTGLRDLNTSNDVVREALIETFAWWASEFDFDGYRIDAVPHMDVEFVSHFCAGLRRALAAQGKYNFLLIGEVFTGNLDDLTQYTNAEGGTDTHFDFRTKFDVIDRVVLGGAAPRELVASLSMDRRSYRNTMQSLGAAPNSWALRVLFADNHDTWRLRGELDREDAAFAALALLFTTPGIPCVYYGTEQEFRGQGRETSRERLWDSHFSELSPTFQHIQDLSAVRAAHVALRRGDTSIRYASAFGGDSDAVDAGFLAVEHYTPSDRVLVLFNAHATQTSSAEVVTGFPVQTRLRDALYSEFEVVANNPVRFSLAPRQVRVLYAVE